MSDVPIELGNVQQVVDYLYQSTTELPEVFPLFYLQIVDSLLAEPGYPMSSQARKQALLEVISDLIAREYFTLRQSNSVDDAPAARIAEDSLRREKNRALLGYSVLYHCHVASDLGLRLSDYVELSGVPERSLLRYKREAVEKLHRALMRDERLARKAVHRQRQYRQLPNMGQKILFGRDELIEHIVKTIENGLRQIALVGQPGVGKSVVCERVLCHLLDREGIDQIIWINQALDYEVIRTGVLQLLGDAPRWMSIESLFATQRVVLVLDGINQPAWSERAWSEFKPFLLLTTSRPRISRISSMR